MCVVCRTSLGVEASVSRQVRMQCVGSGTHACIQSNTSSEACMQACRLHADWSLCPRLLSAGNKLTVVHRVFEQIITHLCVASVQCQCMPSRQPAPRGLSHSKCQKWPALDETFITTPVLSKVQQTRLLRSSLTTTAEQHSISNNHHIASPSATARWLRPCLAF